MDKRGNTKCRPVYDYEALFNEGVNEDMTVTIESIVGQYNTSEDFKGFTVEARVFNEATKGYEVVEKNIGNLRIDEMVIKVYKDGLENKFWFSPGLREDGFNTKEFAKAQGILNNILATKGVSIPEKLSKLRGFETVACVAFGGTQSYNDRTVRDLYGIADTKDGAQIMCNKFSEKRKSNPILSTYEERHEQRVNEAMRKLNSLRRGAMIPRQ
jgi:hypothetical protein